MITSALVFLTAGEFLASWFTDQELVVALTAQVLVVVGVFQVVDSLQITASSVLRGLHDTRIPALIGFVAYWLFGIPIAVYLSMGLEWRAVGVWWGLAAGLAIACVSLCLRTWRKTGAQAP